MNILVASAIVPELEALSQADWVSDSNHQVDTSFVPLDWNSCDESALELSLRLQAAEIPIRRCAVTIGPKNRERFLKTLAALKFDRLIRVDEEGYDLRFCPDAIARVIVALAQEEAAEVILMGRQNSLGENAQTPMLVSELLQIPCFTQVMQVELLEDRILKVSCRVDGGLQTYCVQTPCVLSIGDVPSTYLRVPTLKDKMKFGKLPIEQKSIQDFPEAVCSLHENNVELFSLCPIVQERAGIPVSGETMQEKVHQLINGPLKDLVMHK